MATDDVERGSVVVPFIDMKSIDVVDDLLSSLLPSSIFVKIVSWGVLLIQVKSWLSLATLPLILSLMSDRDIVTFAYRVTIWSEFRQLIGLFFRQSPL